MKKSLSKKVLTKKLSAVSTKSTALVPVVTQESLGDAIFQFSAYLSFPDGGGLSFQAPSLVKDSKSLNTEQLLKALRANVKHLENLLASQMALRNG